MIVLSPKIQNNFGDVYMLWNLSCDESFYMLRTELRKMVWIETSRKIDISGSQSLMLFIYKLGYKIPVNSRMFASIL